MTTKESLALAISELIKRMSPEEKIELMHYISWQELEEWKATEETLADSELMANLKRGLNAEERGNVAGVKF
jgi:uracil phosphoribosyltransferase